MIELAYTYTEIAQGIGISILVCALVDFLVARPITASSPRPDAARWFLLHALINAVITVVVLPDCWTTLSNPHKAVSPDMPYTVYPIYLIFSLHLWHCVLFWRSMDSQDWFHHIVFAFSQTVLGLMWRWGPGSNWYNFFVCGFPGGLDYFLLALLKMGKIHKMTEKLWNSQINTWVRGPGCVSAGVLIFACASSGVSHHIPFGVSMLVALQCGFNGQYYAQRVIASAARTRALEGTDALVVSKVPGLKDGAGAPPHDDPNSPIVAIKKKRK